MNIKWEFTYTCPTCKDEIGANGVCHVCAPRPTLLAPDAAPLLSELADSGIEILSVKPVYSRRRRQSEPLEG